MPKAYYYAYWKDIESKKLRKKYIGGEWIKELSSLYVKERDKVPQLHVRLFIIGLCLTDLNTSIKLRANKFFEKIRDDVKETIYPNLLTEKRPQTLAQFI